MTMSQLLPDKLVEEEILCRVPATSLKRLRATCKLWNGLFNNRRFAKNHFDKSAKQFLFLMLTKEYRIRSLSVELKGELGLLDPLHSVQFKITHVFHCDGLLLCTYEGYHRLVVWNPCTGQTKWLNHPVSRYKGYITNTPGGNITYTLGCYQDKKSHNSSYKILRLVEWEKNQRFEIYEIKSDSWRILDVNPDCILMYNHSSVSLKGKTYWFALDEKELDPVVLLVSFDYTTARFARVCLPNPYGIYRIMSLSVVGEEKLSVLLRRRDALESEIEIWVSNPIDEHKVVSWSKILVGDEPRLGLCRGTSFLVDEEKKIALCCDRGICNQDTTKDYFFLYIIGEDNELTQVDFGASSTWQLHSPLLFNYVPSLAQIQ
ncbi:hypothetical protein BRARA_G00609 [Brassica rapa]|uniref:F-box domain-containing protein n=1 Tax=Brassica campestris TaxID=3711 RepID=A0A397YIA6_BRACM|nr:hypothetical protein BRARA_G00609 [Brassica rapa]CAG7901300.1 unnamed protein product [Brassica rapa]VDC96581.1 unnamed protein product [Brassica rapa]